MNQKIFHGNFSPADFASRIMAHFNRGNLRTRQYGDSSKLTIQIASSESASSGGQTAITITLEKVEDGISVSTGKQAWGGIAASLGYSAFSLLQNPWNILNRLDDIAQDVENLNLANEVERVIDATASQLNATMDLSERLKRLVCDYCDTANPVGAARCLACGAPLGSSQPSTCPHCGYVVRKAEHTCPNCNSAI